jgi:hypothetical protein
MIETLPIWAMVGLLFVCMFERNQRLLRIWVASFLFAAVCGLHAVTADRVEHVPVAEIHQPHVELAVR